MADPHNAAIDAYLKEIAELAKQQSAIEHRRLRVEKAARAMIDVLDDEEEQLRYMELLDDLVRPAGLTNAIRGLLQAAGRTGLTPMEVRDGARVALFGYSNPLASVHTVLKRLARTEDVEITTKDEKPAYKWVTPGERMERDMLTRLAESQRKAEGTEDFKMKLGHHKLSEQLRGGKK